MCIECKILYLECVLNVSEEGSRTGVLVTFAANVVQNFVENLFVQFFDLRNNEIRLNYGTSIF